MNQDLTETILKGYGVRLKPMGRRKPTIRGRDNPKERSTMNVAELLQECVKSPKLA